MKAPQVDAGLRLVKNGQPRAPRQHGRDLDAFALAAGQPGADLAVNILFCAQADLGQDLAQRVLLHLPARSQFHQVADRDALEAHRLLEGVGNAALGALGHAQAVDDAAIEQDFAAVRLGDARNELGEAGFAAAVRAGHHNAFPVRYGQIDVAEHRFVRHAPTDIV